MEQDDRSGARAGEEMAWQYQTRRGWGTTALGRDPYPVLTAMAILLRIAGWLSVAGGIVFALVQVFPWVSCIMGGSTALPPGTFRNPSCGFAMAAIVPTFGALVVGICLIVFGEVIGVFRGIEGNTRQMLSRLEQVGLQNKLTGEGRGS
jgi:hypothetical protein